MLGPTLNLGDRLQFALRGMWSAWGAAWLVVALAVFLRRLTGHVVSPLPWTGWFVLALVLVSASWVFRNGRHLLPADVDPRWIVAMRGLPAIANFLVLLAVTIEGSSLVGVIFGWVAVVAAETITFSRDFWEARGGGRLEDRRESPAEGATASPRADRILALPALSEDESLPDDVEQQWVRGRIENGETMSGLMRVIFAPEERLICVHVPFYPAFERVPRIDVAVASGPEVSFQVTQVEVFGVRLEAKRAGRSESPENVVLQFEATTADE